MAEETKETFVPRVAYEPCNSRNKTGTHNCKAMYHRPRTDGTLYPPSGYIPHPQEYREEWIKVDETYLGNKAESKDPPNFSNIYKGSRSWQKEEKAAAEEGAEEEAEAEEEKGDGNWILDDNENDTTYEPHAKRRVKIWGPNKGYGYIPDREWVGRRGQVRDSCEAGKGFIWPKKIGVKRRIPNYDYHRAESCNNYKFKEVAESVVLPQTPYQWLTQNDVPWELKCLKKSLTDKNSGNKTLSRIKRCILERNAQTKAFDEAYGYNAVTENYEAWVDETERKKHASSRKNHESPITTWQTLGKRCMKDLEKFDFDDTRLYMNSCRNCDEIKNYTCLILVPYKTRQTEQNPDGTYGLKYVPNSKNKRNHLNEWAIESNPKNINSDYRAVKPELKDAEEIQTFLNNDFDIRFPWPKIKTKPKKFFCKWENYRVGEKEEHDETTAGYIINKIAEILFNDDNYMLYVYIFLKGVCDSSQTLRAKFHSSRLSRNNACKYWKEVIDHLIEMKKYKFPPAAPNTTSITGFIDSRFAPHAILEHLREILSNKDSENYRITCSNKISKSFDLHIVPLLPQEDPR